MKTFASAAMKVFGKKPDQSLASFNDELKELTPADRVELAQLMEAEIGEEVDPNPPQKKS